MAAFGIKGLGLAGSAVLLTAGGAAGALAQTPVPTPDAPVLEAQAAVQVAAAAPKPAAVTGAFAFSQTELTPTDAIARAMGDAPRYLCGNVAATEANGELAADEWSIEVGGAVANPLVMTADDLREEAQESIVMGCSCAGNPAGGAASINAEVTGISVLHLMKMVEPDAAANTVVFTSADGFEVALPLRYLAQHYCPIVFAVNGDPLAETMGGVNQLWLGSTSARYFARNVVAVTFEVRDEAPAAPGSPEAGDTYENLPNVGVFFGGEVE